jgi:hypothetical protein
LLIDPQGNVVYTAYKGVDLGSNILTGPYRGGTLTSAYTKAMQGNDVDYVGVTDFGDYQPADEPTAWMFSHRLRRPRQRRARTAVPHLEDQQLDDHGQALEESGVGKTGETFIVGPDDLMRSDSRLFVEDPKRYVNDVVKAGTPPDVAQDAIRQKTTVLVQPVATAATRLAQQGQRGTVVAGDYLGKETLQAYGPVDIAGLHWTVIAKIDTSEAFAPIWAFTRKLVLSTVLIIFFVCLAAMLLARLFVRPIRRLEAGAPADRRRKLRHQPARAVPR